MSRNHIHMRYDLYPPTVKIPVKMGDVEIGTELYEQWQGPNGWYYCFADDGECFDREGLGVNPSGSCWVNSEHECVGPDVDRDVSYYVKDFRFRGDLGPPMSITGLPSNDGYPDDASLDNDNPAAGFEKAMPGLFIIMLIMTTGILNPDDASLDNDNPAAGFEKAMPGLFIIMLIMTTGILNPDDASDRPH